MGGVLEARDRVGGRTLAVPALPGSPEGEGLDLGATWGWSHHPYLMGLCRELGLPPRLAAHRLHFTPGSAAALQQALREVPTR
ncbi:amine oxidase [Hymenobacter roseosalivarius DSM 11622]|uniref:Amine oxidase n=2 Tax=Hymenobacter roseosalivarius TaxID=89967 RepID=A0A1W1UIX3_9BACT|nr:amine oxidase [Hymenobacter roseosalivarius DSM 11622]